MSNIVESVEMLASPVNSVTKVPARSFALLLFPSVPRNAPIFKAILRTVVAVGTSVPKVQFVFKGLAKHNAKQV